MKMMAAFSNIWAIRWKNKNKNKNVFSANMVTVNLFLLS